VEPSPPAILLRADALRRTWPTPVARSRMPSEALAKEGGNSLRLLTSERRRASRALHWPDRRPEKTAAATQLWEKGAHGKVQALGASHVCRVLGPNEGGCVREISQAGIRSRIRQQATLVNPSVLGSRSEPEDHRATCWKSSQVARRACGATDCMKRGKDHVLLSLYSPFSVPFWSERRVFEKLRPG
jgi:hypothetical protein